MEDEPKLANLLRKGLTAQGLAADIATDGDEATWMATATSTMRSPSTSCSRTLTDSRCAESFAKGGGRHAGTHDHRARHHSRSGHRA